jgi:hypothetical protein
MAEESEEALFDAGDLSTENDAEEQAATDYDEAASSGENEQAVGPHALMAPIDVGEIRDQVPRLRCVPFDLGIEHREVEVAAGKGRYSRWALSNRRCRSHDLHVLLRNKRSPRPLRPLVSA